MPSNFSNIAPHLFDQYFPEFLRMCGITGFVSPEVLDSTAMLNILGHRGPDASGAFSTEACESHVFLGHTRLSIIDLSEAGNQPMFAAGGQIAMVYNGEIYNFRELRDRYLSNVELRSQTDTEVALRLYEKLGLDFMHQLNGDFAIAIFDARKNKLYLIRDRAGVKPLYFWHSGRQLLFASEIKSIIAGGIRPELAYENLRAFFVFKYVPGDATLFKGIRRLPPAHYLEYDLADDTLRTNQYWKFETADGKSALNYSDAQDSLRALVEDATRIRLMADVPVGTFLSGGLDSSIIASFLKGNDRITHYCASQSQADNRQEGTTSDAYYARRLSDDWGLRFQPVDIGDANVNPEQIRTTAYYADDLIADAAQIPSYLITRGAAQTSKVFLSGMGADELFLGYAGHYLALFASYLDMLPFAPTILRPLGRIDQGKGGFLALRRYLYRLGKYSHYPAYKYGIFSIVGDFENSAGVLRGESGAIEERLAGYFPEDSDPFESFKRFEYENFLQKNLSYVDAMSMANSVEVRVPYLDHRIMEFAHSLPRSYKLSGRAKAKRILVDAFADRVPRYIRQRRKAGFGMPIRSIFGSRRRVDELLDLAFLEGVADVNIPHINNLIDNHVEGTEDNSSIIYALISFQEWYRVHFIDRPRS